MVCTVRLAGLALLAESGLTRGFDGERRSVPLYRFMRREGGVAGGGFPGPWQDVIIILVEGRSWICEDGRCVAPVEEDVENDSKNRGYCAYAHSIISYYPSKTH